MAVSLKKAVSFGVSIMDARCFRNREKMELRKKGIGDVLNI